MGKGRRDDSVGPSSLAEFPVQKSLIVPLVVAFALPTPRLSVASDAESADTVVISATRIPTPESQVASSLTVITADDVAARQSRTLPDLLKDAPGLNLIQVGGPGGLTSIFIRGTNANHTKVLVDGIEVSDPSSFDGSFDFSRFLTQDIQTVEILRGPQSGLYGSDAIGGVINITTQSGSGPAQLKATAEGGSFETFNQGAGVSGSTGGFHYAANVAHVHSGATPVTPLELLAPGEPRNDDYYDNLTGSTKLGYDITDHLDVGLVARYIDSHLRLTGDDPFTFPSTPEAQQSATNTRQLYTRASAHLRTPDGLFEETLGIAYNLLDSSDFTPPADGPPSYFSSERIRLDWQGNVRLAKAETLVLGVEHQRDEIRSPLSAALSIDSGYAELQSGFGNTLFNTLSARYDHNDHFGGRVTYRIAPVFVIQQSGTRIKASLGTGFKAPTLDELFHDYPAFNFFANPNLVPESSRGYDAGFEQALAGGAFTFGATYFRNDIHNLISDNADFTSYANIGRARTDGAEAFVAYQPSKAITIRLDYTFTQAMDEVLDEELLRRPKHKVSLNATWQATTRLLLHTTVLSVGDWIDANRDLSVPRLTAPGYTTVDIAASFDLDSRLSLFGRIDNLLDRRFQNPIGFQAPGFGAFAGVKLKL
jgi:vitamin B12 transporter